jgi:hypothetical protein
MNKVLMITALVVCTAPFAGAKSIAGDWQGTLSTPNGDLRLVLHITEGGDGSLTATLDSVDQNANGIPVTTVMFKDSKLTLEVEAVHGTYEGTVNSDGTEIKGTWTQGQPLPLDFKRGAAPAKAEHKPAKPSDIDGTWSGTLAVGGTKLRAVFHITNTADGLTATMDSPDQGGYGLPATSVTRTGSSLKVELKGIGGAFEGKISGDLATIEGTWTQGGGSVPLVLKRGK